MKKLVTATVIVCLAVWASGSKVADESRASASLDLPAPVESVEPNIDEFSDLEDPTGPKALAWVEQQNKRTDSILHADPRYSTYYKKILDQERRTEMAEQEGRTVPPGAAVLYRGWMYETAQSRDHPRGLWRRAALQSFLDGSPRWEPLLDLDALSKVDGRAYGTVLLLPSMCRPSGDRCMVSLGESGGYATAREFDLTTQRFVPGGFSLPPGPVNFAWYDDDSLLMDVAQWQGNKGLEVKIARNDQPLVLSRLTRGSPLQTATPIFRVPVDAAGSYGESVDTETYIDGDAAATESSRITIICAPQTSVAGHVWNRYWIRLADEFQPLNLPITAEVSGLYHGEIIFRLAKNSTVDGQQWPAGSLLSVPLTQATHGVMHIHRVRVPGRYEGDSLGTVIKGGFLVLLTEKVRGELWCYTFDGEQWQGHRYTAMPINGIIGPYLIGDPLDDQAFVSAQSLIDPPALYAVSVNGPARKLSEAPAAFDRSKLIMEQLEAISQDGTHVPYFIARAKHVAHDGKNPTLLFGYGAFGTPVLPYYQAWIAPWMSGGGIYVIANIRGGSEFGAAWHVIRTDRHRTYEDFLAVAHDLVRRKLTSPEHLGIIGESAGGLLIGVMVTQHPEQFNAAVMKVPGTDLFRGDLIIGGQSLFDEEFGRLGVPSERAFMEHTSPFQRLRTMSQFPCPLIITSTVDTTVFPGQPRRFAAKAATLHLPYLFMETKEGGHGLASTPEEHAELEATINVYLAQRLMDSSTEVSPSKCERL
jgi:prolyl oligopeptidase